MIIKYLSCDGYLVEEKVDKIDFVVIRDNEDIELVCQRSIDNPLYDANDGFEGKFYISASSVDCIKD